MLQGRTLFAVLGTLHTIKPFVLQKSSNVPLRHSVSGPRKTVDTSDVFFELDANYEIVQPMSERNKFSYGSTVILA